MSSTAGASYPGVLPPPPGVTPNLADPESTGWSLILASVLGLVVAAPFWLLRLYTARCIIRRFRTDDCACSLRSTRPLVFLY